MSGKSFSPVARRTLAAAAFGALLIGASVPAHATITWWWPFKPKPQPTPEIDAGLVRGAAAILVGGLLVLRGRRRRES
jgi:hypothetical protein